jgi:hypothetical protein
MVIVTLRELLLALNIPSLALQPVCSVGREAALEGQGTN